MEQVIGVFIVRHGLLAATACALVVSQTIMAQTLKVSLSFSKSSSSTVPVQAVLEVEPTDQTVASSKSAQPWRQEVQVPGNAVIHLPAKDNWTARLVADDYWCSKQLIPFHTSESKLTLRLFPVGEIRGVISTSNQEAIAGNLIIAFRDVASYVFPDEDVPQGEASCPILEGRIQCSIPAGEMDLKFSVDGYAPFYLWDVKMEPRAIHDIKMIPLVRGGSVSGWVVDRAGRPLEGVSVRGELATARPIVDVIAGSRLESLGIETTTNERGFFQFQGVAAGTYSLMVSLEGYAPARATKSVSVKGDLASELAETLVLREYSTLDLVLKPSLDLLGNPWRVRVVATNTRMTPNLFGAVAHFGGGRWQKSGLVPGTYRLEVMASDDSVWWAEEIDLETDRLVFIDVPVLAIRGTVTMDSDPVPGSLWLRCDSGPTGRFVVEESGEFYGYLAREARCRVTFQRAESDVVLGLHPVRIRKADGEDGAILDIEIPNTRLEGEVVDVSGQAVPEAQVTLVAGRRPENLSDRERRLPVPVSEVATDDRGRFEIWGIPPGGLTVRAEKGERSSDHLNLDLNEGTSPSIRLVLYETLEISGWIQSRHGAVPGASVIILPDLATSAGGGAVSQATSDVDGTFVFELQSNVQAVSLIVQSPGYATRILRESIQPDRPIIVELDPDGGSLILEIADGDLGLMLVHQTALIPVGFLRRLARGRETSRLEIPHAQSGHYSLCTGSAVSRAMLQGVFPGEHCGSGFLPRGGTLTLSLPNEPGDKDLATRSTGANIEM